MTGITTQNAMAIKIMAKRPATPNGQRTTIITIITH